MAARPILVVLGGGPAGYFGAIRAAEAAPQARVILLEATGTPLQKVRISGGGRCNVTHHQFDPALLVTRYPRGAKELRGVFARFGPRETMAWFEGRGVRLKVEPDGRVFPASDSSETIIDCLEEAAARADVEVRLHESVRAVERIEGGLRLHLKGGDVLDAAALLVATGSNPQGVALAASLGHTLVPPVPSLFTFNMTDPRLEGLAGVSVERVRARLVTDDGAKHEQEGSFLVTHWGLSALVVLRLSAWAARDLHSVKYRSKLVVDFVPDARDDDLRARCERMRVERPLGTVAAHGVAPEVPRRLWDRLLAHAGLEPEKRWVDVSNKEIARLVEGLKRSSFEISGKGPFREEFVTSGGVSRKEVDWRTMESRLVPGLYFAGEVLDVDALTGGFNFQAAWSAGWIAGSAMAERAVAPKPSAP